MALMLAEIASRSQCPEAKDVQTVAFSIDLFWKSRILDLPVVARGSLAF
jgi:hypothetical protein